MVIGGNFDYVSDSEFVDLSPEGGICTVPANFQEEADFGIGAVGGFIDGMPTVCGGNERGRECHGYSLEAQSWSKLPFKLTESRQQASGLALKNGSLVVIGGKSDQGKALATSETFVGRQFIMGQIWPTGIWAHCTVEINSTHAFLAGGENERGSIRESYFYRISNGRWMWIAEMTSDRSGHVCGVVKRPSENIDVVIAGGKVTLEVEILSVSSGELRRGPSLPHEIHRGAAIQTGRGFVVLGGKHLGACPVFQSECFVSRQMYDFEAEGETWMRRNSTMKLPRGGHSVVRLPRKINACSKSCPSCPGKPMRKRLRGQNSPKSHFYSSWRLEPLEH